MDENATNSKNTDNKAKKPYIDDNLTGADQIELLYKKQRFQEKMILGHQKSLDRIRRARMKNPVSLECPRCGGGREIYRFTGVVRCPFCDSVEMLPEEHKFIPEIDDPKRMPQKPPQVNTPKQHTLSANSNVESVAIISIIAGVLSFLFLGALFFIEIFGVIMGRVALVKLHEKPETKKVYIETLVGIFLNLASLVIFIGIIIINIAFEY